MGNRASGTITFHEGSTSVGDGKIVSPGGIETVNIEFNISTGGSFTANFEGRVTDDGAWFPLTAVNLSTLDIASTASDATAAYQIDCTGWAYIKIRISALSGTLSAYGRAVY